MPGLQKDFPYREDEFEPAPGDGEGQGSLVCCRHGVTELDLTERLNNSNSYTCGCLGQ